MKQTTNNQTLTVDQKYFRIRQEALIIDEIMFDYVHGELHDAAGRWHTIRQAEINLREKLIDNVRFSYRYKHNPYSHTPDKYLDNILRVLVQQVTFEYDDEQDQFYSFYADATDHPCIIQIINEAAKDPEYQPDYLFEIPAETFYMPRQDDIAGPLDKFMTMAA